MAPVANIDGIQIHIKRGDAGVKKTYGGIIEKIWLCLSDEKALRLLNKYIGMEIVGLSGDKHGVVFERSSGRVFRSGETLEPRTGGKFILAGTERTRGKEII